MINKCILAQLQIRNERHLHCATARAVFEIVPMGRDQEARPEKIRRARRRKRQVTSAGSDQTRFK